MNCRYALITGCALLLLSCQTTMFKSPEALYQQGEKLLKENKSQQAYKYFLAAAKKAPDSARYDWAAALCATNRNATFKHAQMAWKYGLRTPRVLDVLLKSGLHTTPKDLQDNALSLYKELPDSFKTDEYKGELFFGVGVYDSAISLLEPQFNKKPGAQLAIIIGQAMSRSSTRSEQAIPFLRQCRLKGLHSADCAILEASLHAMRFEFGSADTLYMQACAQYPDSLQCVLEYALFLTVNSRLDQAEKLLKPVAGNAGDSSTTVAAVQARTNLAYIYALKKDSASLAAMESRYGAKSLEKKVVQLMRHDPRDTSWVIETMGQLLTRMPPNPIYNLIYAREMAGDRNYAKAKEIYQGLSGVVFNSPPVIGEYAMTLTQLGEDTLALVALSRMHRHGVFTRQSLMLFRDLTYKQQLVDKCASAQKLLEKKYPADLSIRTGGAIMALKRGKTDSALVIIDGLIREFPAEPRLKAFRLSILLMKGDYDRVITEGAAVQPVPAGNVPLVARAYVKKGMTDEACRIYETALAAKANVLLEIEYAELLIGSGKYDRASAEYAKILAAPRDSTGLDSMRVGALLNNQAWAMLQAPDGDKKLALTTAKHAWELAPGNPNILDTYAAALIAAGDYKECIRLLEKEPATRKSSRLLFHLGTCYEKTDQRNKSVRAFMELTQFPDSTFKDLPASKQSILDRIEQLKNKS